ncbi:MAG: competence protein TfoX [Chloroflexi bacterium CFX4]|nr:competence protein TfoX [Chloroflexi bacterium CFX4]MDL1921001.1 competence protein TfoX [Chloroflexi bacterium CFX3]
MLTPPTDRKPDRKIAQLLNLGERAAEHLASIGIYTESDLRQAGIVEAYLQLKAMGYRQWTLLGLWAMWGALHDTHWQQVPPEVKEELRRAVKPAKTPTKRKATRKGNH